LNVHGVNVVRQTEKHTAEPLLPEPSVFEFDCAIESIKSHKSKSIDQIPAELIKAGYRTISYETNKCIIYIWNKEELSEEWKESIIVHINKGAIYDCSNYRSITILSTTFKILSNIQLSRLTQNAEEMIADHQCGFRCNRSTT